MAGDFKNVRVVANANLKGMRTVNIITTTVDPKKQKHTQLTAAQTATAAKGTIETVQDSGGQKAGLKTIFIAGYAGPN